MKSLIKYYALLIVLSIQLTSCLKDTDFDKGLIQSVHSNGTQKIVEIKLNAISSSNFLHQSFNASNSDTTFNLIPVVLSSNAPATEDIKVTLVQDSTLVDAYNAGNGTSYVTPPSGSYTIVNPGGVVTIPKGSNIGYLQVKLNPSDFLGN